MAVGEYCYKGFSAGLSEEKDKVDFIEGVTRFHSVCNARWEVAISRLD